MISLSNCFNRVAVKLTDWFISIVVSYFIVTFLHKIRQVEVFPQFSPLSFKLQQDGQFLRLRYSAGFS